jgi:hypothetical protein
MKVIAALLITLSVASAWKKCNRNHHFDAERNQLCCRHRSGGSPVWHSLADASSPARKKLERIYICQCDPEQNDEIIAASNGEFQCLGVKYGGVQYHHIAPLDKPAPVPYYRKKSSDAQAAHAYNGGSHDYKH